MDNSIKDRILDAVDIVDVVGQTVALTRKGKDFVGLCPFHPDHKPSLSVSPSKRIFKCWSCGVGGDVIRFVQHRDRVDFHGALSILAKRAGIELRPLTPRDRQAAELREQIQSAVAWARAHFRHNFELSGPGRGAREYATRRGLSAETLERFGVGLALDGWDNLVTAARRAGLRPDVLEHAGLVAKHETGRLYDRFRNRLVFPIADAAGRPVAFGGRTLADDPAKYLNSPETVLFSKSRVLYGFDLARPAIAEADAAIVVEGYMDAVLLHQYGFRQVVATLGTALTDAHVKLLEPVASTVYLCFDGDEAGVRAAQRGVDVALRTGLDVRVVVLEGDKDPADCVISSGAAGFEAALSRAVDALEFRWRQTLRTFDHSGTRGRRAAIEEFLRFVASATAQRGADPLQQSLLLDRISELTGVPTDAVFEEVARVRRRLLRPVSGSGAAAGCSEVSDYEATIRGLSPGLVTAMESLLGLLIRAPECWRDVDDALARAAEHCETWQRLYGVLLDVHADEGEYSVGHVVARCEDSAVCELVDRAQARVRGVTSFADDFAAARARLREELAILEMGGLREQLRPASAAEPAEEPFRRLRELAREHASVLPVESRWRGSGTRGE